jgi:hypothetical protein
MCNWHYDATQATVKRLTTRIGIVGHKLYVDSFSSDLFDDLCSKTINSCGTVRSN